MTTLPMLVALLTIGQKDTAEASLATMQARVAATTVSLRDPAAKPELVAAPVFRYSDQLRHIEDAGLWIWTVQGRPLAALKVERYSPGIHPRPWLYCFTSLSPELVTGEWAGAPAYRSKQPGIVWQSLAGKPAATRAARLLQMRELGRRFSAELVRQSEREERSQMRLLPRPLYRCEETGDVIDGALFSFTGTGTNPDLLLLFDLTADSGWRFGLAGMSAEGLEVKLDEKLVWQQPHTAGKGHIFDTWTYFLPSD